jgi:hypothetical protein
VNKTKTTIMATAKIKRPSTMLTESTSTLNTRAAISNGGHAHINSEVVSFLMRAQVCCGQLKCNCASPFGSQLMRSNISKNRSLADPERLEER